MNVQIIKGSHCDLDAIENLYNELNEFYEERINYSGWKKGVYPIRQTAIDGINNGTLFVAKYKEKVVGSIILNHKPESAYHLVQWGQVLEYSDVIVIHTFVVHPGYMKLGVGKTLMDFAEQYSRNLNMKAIRLDVYENNTPAINLYEKCGYQYIDSVDLGLRNYGLDWFRLYEKLL